MASVYKLSYTAQEIDARLGKIDNLAKKSELPTRTSDLTNNSGFITESDMQGYAQPIGDYALKSEIPEMPEIPIVSVNGKIGEVNLTASDIGALPDTTAIPTVPTDISAFTNDVGYLTEHQSLDGFATEDYVNEQIAAIPAPDVSDEITAQIDSHNIAIDAHNDIRDLINDLTTRLNILADSDDTELDQLSEIVDYIKSNKSLIDSITTNKVSISDIIDNLTTNVSNKPLSAAQGVALKALIDAIVVPTKVSELTNDSNFATQNYVHEYTQPIYDESIIGLSVDGTIVTYIKGDGSVHTFETQDTNTTYSLGTDEVTGLTKLYATTGSAEDGTMTQKAIKTELDKKVGVSIDASQDMLIFTI